MRPALLLAALLALALSACGRGDEPAATRSPGNATVSPQAQGPQLILEPRSGPPGTRVTASGSGWQPGATIALVADGSDKPYATVTAGPDGSFVVSFTLEKAPDGSELRVGRFDLVARSGEASLTVPFQVEVRRPVRGPESGG